MFVFYIRGFSMAGIFFQILAAKISSPSIHLKFFTPLIFIEHRPCACTHVALGDLI